MYIGISKLK